MHVTAFGATGKIGRLVVVQLLAAGHEVTALVRTPAKLTIDHLDLTVRTGQLPDAAAVHDVVGGSDAVISALGPSLKRGAPGSPVIEGTRVIVAAMKEAGVRRFIGVATPSVPDPRDRPTFKAELLPLMARLLFPNALTELRGMTAVITRSDLDWTRVRITNPTDKPAKGTHRAGFLGRDSIGWAMTRADIAAFLAAQLSETTYLRAAPAIGN